DLSLASARIFWSSALAGSLDAFSGAFSGTSAAMTNVASKKPARRANKRRGIAFLMGGETRGDRGLNPGRWTKMRAADRPPQAIAINYPRGYAGFITSRIHPSKTLQNSRWRSLS